MLTGTLFENEQNDEPLDGKKQVRITGCVTVSSFQSRGNLLVSFSVLTVLNNYHGFGIYPFINMFISTNNMKIPNNVRRTFHITESHESSFSS